MHTLNQERFPAGSDAEIRGPQAAWCAPQASRQIGVWPVPARVKQAFPR